MKFFAWGHPNVRATHKTTLEITKDDFLTTRGDCILAVKSEVGLIDMKREMENARGKIIKIMLKAENEEDCIEGFVHPHLTFTSRTTIIFRKSNFISERTAAIHCNKAAYDLKRVLVLKMQNPSTRLEIELLF
jgi:hypothetical protein